MKNYFCENNATIIITYVKLRIGQYTLKINESISELVIIKRQKNRSLK